MTLRSQGERGHDLKLVTWTVWGIMAIKAGSGLMKKVFYRLTPDHILYNGIYSMYRYLSLENVPERSTK